LKSSYYQIKATAPFYPSNRQATMDYKPQIIEALSIMRRRDIAEKQTFKVRAYTKVIAQLEKLPSITSYDDVVSLEGIGARIKENIKEILATGSLKSAENAKEIYHLDTLDTLMNIYGVGPAKAKSLINDHKVTSIADLREKLKSNPKLLNDNQKAGLQHYEDLLLRIPREEMEEHQSLLLSNIPNKTDAEIVGSFRRGAANSGDIDMLIRGNDPTLLHEFAYNLQTSNYIKYILAMGDKKILAISQLPGKPARRLDLLLTPPDEYAFAILYFTGSDTFNVAFRQHALERGYTLNEHALTPLTTASPVPPLMKTEEDIFKFLGLVYTPPDQRTGATAVKLKPKRKIRIVGTE
jgi:DNA polymerase/3'-5' exonuclease PolX